MSEENVELAYRASDAFNRRDISAFIALCDPDIEIESGRVLIGTPTYQGHEGVERLFRDMTVAWEELRGEPHDVVSVASDEVVVVAESHGKGKTTGASFAASTFALMKFAQGKVVRCEFFPDKEEALEAAGLRE